MYLTMYAYENIYIYVYYIYVYYIYVYYIYVYYIYEDIYIYIHTYTHIYTGSKGNPLQGQIIYM